MSKTTVIGHEAIEMAKRSGRTLSKYADPTDGARTGLSVAEAEEIAKEDPALVYLETEIDEAAAQAAALIMCDSATRSGPWARRSRD